MPSLRAFPSDDVTNMANNTSFQSFVDYDGKPSPPVPTIDMRGVSRELLPHEIECTTCDDVSLNFQFQEPVPGKITCTNFCLFFQPFIVSSKLARVPRRFTIMDEHFTIPLCTIETVFYSILQTDLAPTSKEMKELTAPLSNMEAVSYLKLFLKDFRVVLIDMTRTQHAPQIANELLCFSKPPNTKHLIQAGAKLEWLSRLEYNDEKSWKNELDNCGTRGNWRICHTKRELCQSTNSYPSCVVVPLEINSHDLVRILEHYVDGRFPIWVWSFSNGTDLLRSSMHDDIWIVKDVEKKYNKHIVADNSIKNHVKIEITDANSLPAVRSAYKRLRKLCSIDSHEMYNSREKDWFTRLHETGWTQLVFYCLKTAAEVIRAMVDQTSSVTLVETEGKDISAVISSLVQISAAPENRTMQGMEHLINKEWIALGHPFGERICGVGKNPTAPTFLLFLDCVAQMKRLYPTQFGYSDHFLIALWDISLTGCVPAFACSSLVDQLAENKKGGPFPLTRFFSEDYRVLFSNPFREAAYILQQPLRSLRNKVQIEPAVPFLGDVLRPPTLPVDVELWDICYLRWIPRANSLDGGEMMSEIKLDEMMEAYVRKTGHYWGRQRPKRDFETETLGPAYPYSLPLVKPYILYNLEEQVDSLSINSTNTYQKNLKQTKDKSRSESLTIQAPTPPPRPIRRAPPPPPAMNSKNSDSVYRTHF